MNRNQRRVFGRYIFELTESSQCQIGRRAVDRLRSERNRARRLAIISVGVIVSLTVLSCSKPEASPRTDATESAPVERKIVTPSDPPTHEPQATAKREEQSKEPKKQEWILPLYPGATKIEESVRGVVTTYTLKSKDSPNKVIEFYRDKIGDIIGEVAIGPTATIEGQRLNEHFTIVAMELGDETQIEIRIEQSP